MSVDDQLPISQHHLLSIEDCTAIRARVITLRRRWTKRASANFYTLGTASYIDAPDNHHAYLEAARVTNPILQEHFHFVLDLVRAFLEQFLGDPVFYDPHYALPGFHIFITKGSDEKAPRGAHFDLQWMHAFPKHEPRSTLSFTLPIEEPSGGACLAVWPARYQDAVRLGFSAFDFASRHPWQRLTYERGRMVLHDGYVLHAIGPAVDPTSRGYRITLQGHGVRTPRGWMLYW